MYISAGSTQIIFDQYLCTIIMVRFATEKTSITPKKKGNKNKLDHHRQVNFKGFWYIC